MLAIMKETAYTFSDHIVGKKVILFIDEDGIARIRGSEAIRHGCNPNTVFADFAYHIQPHEYEVVKPKLQNCSDSNVGKGWEGFYEQKPIKKSKFRNH